MPEVRAWALIRLASTAFFRAALHVHDNGLKIVLLCFALACCSWAQAAGFVTDLWTRQRVAEHIERTIGVGHHVDHTGRLLHAMNRSPQKPSRKAVEREAFATAPQGASRRNLDAIYSAEGKK